MLQIMALMEDRPSHRKDLLAEHGLSLYVGYNGRQMLFDCGSGANTLHNAYKLGVEPERLDAVVLSHGHYDHAGGYRFLVQQGGVSCPLYTGSGFFEPKFSRNDGCHTSLGAGFDRAFLSRQGISHREVDGVTEIFPGAWLISGFPRVYAQETIPPRFGRFTQAGFVSDDFRDEICLALEIQGGVAVLVGCAHPGILNMVSHVRAVLGKSVRAVLGGIHLTESDDCRQALTVDTLAEMGVETLGLCHCSGEAAEQAAQTRRGVRGFRLGPGDCVFLP